MTMENDYRTNQDTTQLIHEYRKDTKSMVRKLIKEGKCVLGLRFDIERNS